MADKSGNILVIDDDPGVLTAAQLLLKRQYAQVVTDEDPVTLTAHLKHTNWDVVLLDMNFAPGANTGDEGLHWLVYILEQQPSTLVILMTAYGAVDTAVKAIQQGANANSIRSSRNALREYQQTSPILPPCTRS